MRPDLFCYHTWHDSDGIVHSCGRWVDHDGDHECRQVSTPDGTDHCGQRQPQETT